MEEGFSTEGMLDMYLFENGQLIEKMEGTTLEKKDEDSFDEATINEFFRIMHTIKGSSGIMMYDHITKVSHKLEDIFYYLRESHPDNIPHLELVDDILQVTDYITKEFEKIKEGEDPDDDPTDLIENMDKFLEKIKGGMKKKGEDLPLENAYVAPSQYYIAPVSTENSHFFRINVAYRPETEMCNIRAYTAAYSLKEIAEDMLYKPEDIISNEDSAKVILEEGFRILLQTQSEQEEILKLIDGSGIDNINIEECAATDFFSGFDNFGTPSIDLDSSIESIQSKYEKNEKSDVTDTKKIELEPGDYVIQSKNPSKPKKQQLAKNSKEKNIQAQQTFISVNVEKMDMLMDLIGEIVIAESVVLQNPDLKVPGLNLANFQKAASQLTKFTSEMQDIIMSMRMMPLSNTFQKMNRIIFDVSKKLGKNIELELIGENTEVDKNIIEHISDPLMHLVRNALDHGIEMGEERIAAGKSEKGKIILEARNEGGKVLIIVKDDGKGMSGTKIFKKAKNLGIIPDYKFESDFSNKELLQLITYPGFSTKEQITEYSGRGVGMDVVARNVQDIGGTVEIDSVEGKGSEVVLKIPLTLAIIDGIIMEVGSATFVIETSAVNEFLSLKDNSIIKEPSGEEYVMVRGNCYPVIRLNQKYGIDDAVTNINTGIMIIVEHDDRKICIFVDHLIGEQEIVVKPIPSYIKKVDGLSGCTQLGDGSIALILDVGGLL